MVGSINAVLWALLYALIVFVTVTVTAYAAARAASFGWHLSKWEHFKRIINFTKGEEENGQG